MDIVPIATKSTVETEWRLRDILISLLITVLLKHTLFFLSDLLIIRSSEALLESAIFVTSFGCASTYLLIKYPLDLKTTLKKLDIKAFLVYGIVGGVLASSKNLFLFLTDNVSVEHSHIIGVENSPLILSFFLLNVILFGPVVEELFWTAGCYRIISRKYSAVWGLIITPFLFSICHIPQKPQIMLELFIYGFIFAYVYEKTKFIGTSIVAKMIFSASYYSAMYYQLI
jgi:membrane protease YdiL (CAAX protease family)